MADTAVLGAFPTFEGSNGPTYQSTESNLALIGVSGSQTPRKPRLSLPAKLTNYSRLRYYRYEVTFGLYVMTPGEKLVTNGIVLAIFLAIFCGVYAGLRPFLVHVPCRLLYYATGTADALNTFCAEHAL